MRYWHSVVLVLCCLLALNGCGQQENKNVVKAKALIADGNYTAAAQEIETALANVPDHAEAYSIRAVLQASSGASSWENALEQIAQKMQPVIDEINELEAKEDPDDDDYKRLDVLVIQRNYALGFLAKQLATAIRKESTLVANLPADLSTQLMLQASRSYTPEERKAAVDVIRAIGHRDVLAQLAQSKDQHPSVREQAILLLGEAGTESLADLVSIAEVRQLAFPVAYGLTIASETIGGKEVIPLLRKLLRVETVQTRLYAITALTGMRANEAIPDLIDLLADNSSYVQNQTKTALVTLGEASIQPLINVLNDRAANVNLPASAQISEDTMSARRDVVQTHVMNILASLKAEQSLPVLIGHMEDTDIGAGARSALGAMGTAAVPALIQLLKTGDDTQRIQAAEILSTSGDLRAVEPLIAALSDSHKDVRAAAAAGLGSMKARGPNNSGIEALSKALESDERTKTNALDALRNIGVNTEAIGRQLVAFAGDSNERQGVRLAAIAAIGTLKPDGAAPVLVRLLMADDENDTLRKTAATALGDINHPDALPTLLWIAGTLKEEIKDFQREMKRHYNTIAGFNDSMRSLFEGELADIKGLYEPYGNWNELKPIPSLVRSEVMVSLGKIKGSEATQALIKALDEDQRAAVRAAAAWALGEIKGDDVLSPLIHALKNDEQGVVRSRAAEALGKIKGEKVIPPLVDTLLHDEFENARLRTAIGLREVKFDRAARGLVSALKGEGDAYEEKEVDTVLNEIMTALRLDGAVAVPALLTAADSKDVMVRKRTMTTLGAIGDARAYDAMFKALNDENVIVRERAAAGIGALKQRKAIPKLIEIAENENEWTAVRVGALNSLGTLRDSRAADVLLKALSSPEVTMRTAAANALGAIRDSRASEVLFAIALNPEEDTVLRQSAVTALASIGYKQAAVELLKQLSKEHEGIYDVSIQALGSLKVKAAAPELNAILIDPTQAELSRRYAANAVADLKDASSADALAKVLVDPTEYRIVIIDNIKRNLFFENVANATRAFIMPKGIIPPMLARLNDSWEHHTIRWSAAIALSRTLDETAFTRVQEVAQEDPHADVRNIAARSLGETRRSQYAPLLIGIATDPEKAHSARRGAIQGLGYLGDASAVAPLIGILQDTTEHEERRRDAAVALGSIGTAEAVAALQKTLLDAATSKALKLDILTGLKTAANNASVADLRTVLDSEDADIHFMVADALYTITGDPQGYQWR